MATAVRIKYPSGGLMQTINFSELEVDRLIIQKKQKVDLQRLQRGKPILIFTGEKWQQITLSLFPKNPDVSDNVETLRTITDVMYLYYNYKNASTTYIPVKVNPNASTFYFGGHKDAERMLNIVFYEASRKITFTFDLKPLGR